MPFSCTAHRLLISAPGDVLDEDIDAVVESVNRWNAIYGAQFGAVALPIHWRVHSAAQHDIRPQGSLNEQLVDQADVVVALFWTRLGTPTGEDDSGTVEEINRASEHGAYVGILSCSRPFPPDVDLEQLGRLRDFQDSIRDHSLITSYDDAGELSRHIDTILSRAITRDEVRAQSAVESTSAKAEVWPRVESQDRTSTDSKGRLRTRRNWHLVLSNTGTVAAENVAYRLESEAEGQEPPIQLDDAHTMESLAPGGEARFGLFPDSGSASQFRCVVSWVDAEGEHENRATLRLY